ncbi:MAG: hypothetical protein JO255_12575, partial [Alphaproteobacteria bacterium]|nr:hypothetical protein [Alphaproteobacteria bacterium]
MQKHIILTSHPTGSRTKQPIAWGAESAAARGPLVATPHDSHRNVIGAHAGSYALYRALAIAAGKLSPIHVPDLTNTTPVASIGPHKQWSDPAKIVSLDPWGHLVAEAFADRLAEHWDIRPTIAVTSAHINMPELQFAISAGRLRPDGKVLLEDGTARVTKAAIEPVWYLPGIAQRFGVAEADLRRSLF